MADTAVVPVVASKPWYTSKTIWAGIAVFAINAYVGLVALLLLFGINLPQIPAILYTVLHLLLGVTVVNSRATATTVIGAIMLMLLCFTSPASATEIGEQDIYWSPLGINLVTPFKYDGLVSIYDFNHSQALVGGETVFGEYGNVQFNAGAVTSLLYAGSPYISANYDIATANLDFLQLELAHIGIAVGFATDKTWIIGIKTSTQFKLWE